MSKTGVLVVSGDREDGQHFCQLLGAMNYAARLLPSLEALHTYLQGDPNVVVILDLDSVPAEKQFFRILRNSKSRLHILGISSLAYHPGLEEVIASLYACLVKPLDIDELGYWLKTISDNFAEAENSPEREVGP